MKTDRRGIAVVRIGRTKRWHLAAGSGVYCHGNSAALDAAANVAEVPAAMGDCACRKELAKRLAAKAGR